MNNEVIHPEWLKRIQESKQLQGIIADKMNKSILSVSRWAANNSEMLYTIKVLECIVSFFQLGDYRELFQEPAKTAA